MFGRAVDWGCVCLPQGLINVEIYSFFGTCYLSRRFCQTLQKFLGYGETYQQGYLFKENFVDCMRNAIWPFRSEFQTDMVLVSPSSANWVGLVWYWLFPNTLPKHIDGIIHLPGYFTCQWTQTTQSRLDYTIISTRET